MSLNDQVMVITGASSGIGAATAELLREAGMRLVINGRRAQPLEELAERLGEAAAIAGDVTDPALPQRLIDAAVDRFGRLDAVFNNAGSGAPARTIDEMPVEDWLGVVAVNLNGAFYCAKAAFTLYLEAFPNHQRTPDAQFRLGEIHLALEENAAAADAFIAHIRNYPNNGRAAEAYLKLGTAFARLDKPTEACTVFKTMKAKHPNAPAAVLQRAELEMARIDCE